MHHPYLILNNIVYILYAYSILIRFITNVSEYLHRFESDIVRLILHEYKIFHIEEMFPWTHIIQNKIPYYYVLMKYVLVQQYYY